MKQNLLKYGLVMVLAVIASTGLVWADSYIEVEHDTCIVEKIDSLRLNLSIQQAFNAYCNTCAQDSTSIAATIPNDKFSFALFLKVLKEFPKEILLAVVMAILSLSELICFILVIIFLFTRTNRIRRLLLKSWQISAVWLFFCVSLMIDSSWFYLVTVALMLYYADKCKMFPDLINGLSRIMRLMQGKLEVYTTSSEEKKQTLEKEAVEEYKNIQAEQRPQSKPEKVWVQERVSDGERIEGLAMDYYEAKYPALQRNIYLMIRGKRKIRLDGLYLGEDKNIVLDILYCTSLPALIRHKLDDLLEAANYLRQRTSIFTIALFSIIVPEPAHKASVQAYVRANNFNGIEVEVYTEDELKDAKQSINKQD